MNVTESKPVLEQFTVIERAVLYARVSGDDRGKEGRNLQGQLDMGREYAIQKGYRIVEELPEDDKGASGAEINLPQLNRIRDMAHAGKFDVLIVRELDRLSRDLAKQLVIEEELNHAGVRVEYVLEEYQDSPEGRLNKHIRATIAEYEREKIRERLVRGRRLKTKAGSVIVGGRPPYGYHLVKRDNTSSLEIDEIEAAIVKMIFQWYTVGERGWPLTLVQIQNKLNQMRVPTLVDTGKRNPAGKKKRQPGEWGRSAIHHILKNETYAGVWHYGKIGRSKGKYQRNPPDQWIAVKVPAIIDRATFEAAQNRMAKNKEKSGRNAKNQYLMSKRLTCHCGYKIYGLSANDKKKRLFYGCPGRKDRDFIHACDLPYFPADKVDAVIWEWVRSFFENPKLLEQGIERYKAQQAAATAPAREQLAIVEKMVSENKHKLKKWREMYVAELIGQEELMEATSPLNQIITSLTRRRDELTATIQAATLDLEEIRAMADYVSSLKEEVGEGLDLANDNFTAKRHLIERLNVEATLLVENGEKIVDARCWFDVKRLKLSASI